MFVNDIFAVVALVTQVSNGVAVGTASGFFYARNDRLFLVTNRHVVTGGNGIAPPDILRLRLHKSMTDLTTNVDFDVPLTHDGKRTWHDHPRYQLNQSDVAVIELDRGVLKGGYYIKALSAQNFLPANFVMQPGEDVMVIGFPRGLSDTKHNLALIRSALVSSAYGVPFNGQPYFIIDANLHPGTSGSPVLTRPKNAWNDQAGNTNFLTGAPIYFLGIHSGTLSVRVGSATEALGLAQVWYGNLIEEIVDSFSSR